MYIAKMVIGSPPNAFAEFLRTLPESLSPSTPPVEVDAALSTPAYHPAEPFPPFTAPVQFRFDERVNLFVGPNATGKSTLLAHLFERLSNDISETRVACSWGTLEFPEPDPDDPLERLAREMGLAPASPNERPLIAIPAMRAGYAPDQPHQAIIKQGTPRFVQGTPRFVAGSIVQPVYGENVQHLVDEFRSEIEDLYTEQRDFLHDQYFEDNPELQDGLDWDEYHSTGNEYIEAAEMLRHALNISYACAREICHEIIAGEVPHDATIVHERLTDAGLPTVSATLEMAARVQTSDPAQNDADASPLPIAQLSAGTQGTLWWIRLIALCLLKAFNYWSGWEKRPAILLIDEIENHLHPTWQRRVIPTLLKYFPGLQIFATTHSPFVVAGLKAGQVHILQRNADSGVITASTNAEDIVGWTMDEILRAFMGVADPTDDATATAAHELRQLRSAGPAAAAPDEERRQTRMQHLRRQVDRDLLAGGPMAAQQELFEQQFAEALAKHRRARDLNQEGA